jgi:hypothetical protein
MEAVQRHCLNFPACTQFYVKHTHTHTVSVCTHTRYYFDSLCDSRFAQQLWCSDLPQCLATRLGSGLQQTTAPRPLPPSPPYPLNSCPCFLQHLWRSRNVPSAPFTLLHPPPKRTPTHIILTHALRSSSGAPTFLKIIHFFYDENKICVMYKK